MYFSNGIFSTNKLTLNITIVLIFLTSVKGAVEGCGDNEFAVRGHGYVKEVLLNLSHTSQPRVDLYRNVLFYNYWSVVDDVIYTGYLNLDTMERGTIPQVPSESEVFAVHRNRPEAYIRKSDRFYKFYYNNRTVERVERNAEIKSILHQDELTHVITPMDPSAKKINSGATVLLSDKDGYYFFWNSSGLYGRTEGSRIVDKYAEGLMMGGMITDTNGLPYMCDWTGIYFANKYKKALEKIIDYNDISTATFGLAFDKNNNMIYSTMFQIVRLRLKHHINETLKCIFNTVFPLIKC